MKTTKKICKAIVILPLLNVSMAFSQPGYIPFTVNQPVQLVVTAVATTNAVCPGNPVTLSGSGAATYTWTGGVTNGVAFTPTSTSTYTVTGTDINNCTATNEISIAVTHPYSNEQICLVTVDTVAWKNKVMWEKTAGVGTGTFYVYKEVAANVYNYLGSVPYDSAGYYIDYTSVPESHGDKYKISVIDTCTTESTKSYYHMTMNLVISTFGSTMGLSWTPYQDESGNYVPSKYYIYRGAQPNNMSLLDSISSSFTSYNDNNVFDTYYYMVGVKKDGNCSTSKTNSSMSFSNNKKNFGSGVDEININSTISIFPNPFTEKSTIEFSNPANNELLLTIFDVTGKEIRKEYISGNKFVIERSNLENGFYTIELKSKNRIFRNKIIVE